MKPAEIDELIAMVEAGEDVHIRYPYGPTVRLTEADLDDLRLARALAVDLGKASERFDDWLRQVTGEPGYDERWRP